MNTNYQTYYINQAQQEVNFSAACAIPFVGIPAGLIRAVLSLEQIGSGLINVFQKDKALSEHGWVQIKHGFGNMAAGLIEGIPFVGTISAIFRAAFGQNRLYMPYPSTGFRAPKTHYTSYQPNYTPSYQPAFVPTPHPAPVKPAVTTVSPKSPPEIEACRKDLKDLQLQLKNFDWDAERAICKQNAEELQGEFDQTFIDKIVEDDVKRKYKKLELMVEATASTLRTLLKMAALSH